MVYIRHNADWYVKRYPDKSPLKCMICDHEIPHGETYESTYHGKNCFCWQCSQQTILVYQPKHGKIRPHNKVEGFKKCGENSISSYRHQG